jgi:hypothetical protein
VFPDGSAVLTGYQVPSLEGFVCGIYSVEVRVPDFQNAVPNLALNVELSGLPTIAGAQFSSVSQSLTIAVAPYTAAFDEVKLKFALSSWRNLRRRRFRGHQSKTTSIRLFV